ncbi:hypothetical protein BC828DRAFT_405873 [Blastocladiella britannica]|nr:hypothetical protein BC828DRAFT_405873 [Blastocladiella britannica]
MNNTTEIVINDDTSASVLSAYDAKLVKQVLDHWFGGNPKDPKYAPTTKLWFGSTPDDDAEIARKFGHLLAEVHQHLGLVPRDTEHGDNTENNNTGLVARWTATPASTFALLLLTDQLSRHIHRGTALMFATDHLAAQLADQLLLAVPAGESHALHWSPCERIFLYHPYMHLEDQTAARRTIALMDSLVTDISQALAADPAAVSFKVVTTARSAASSARKHNAILHKFGRFPYRNALVGRESTQDETDWLATDGAKRSTFVRSVTNDLAKAAAQRDTAAARARAAEASTTPTSDGDDTTETAVRPIRLLVLHGYRQNAHTMKRALAGLGKQFPGRGIDMVRVNSPTAYMPEATAGDVAGGHGTHGATVARPHQRAWWNPAHNANGGMVYDGAAATLSYLRGVFRDLGPFDGIIGFSQGAVLAGILSERRDEFPHDFAVLISGFPARDPKYAPAGKLGNSEVPSLHIYGKHDTHLGTSEVMKANTFKLAEVYGGKGVVIGDADALTITASTTTVVEHPGGHFTPQNWPMARIAAFMRQSVKRAAEAPTPVLATDASLKQKARAALMEYRRLALANLKFPASDPYSKPAPPAHLALPLEDIVSPAVLAAVRSQPALSSLAPTDQNVLPELAAADVPTVDWAAVGEQLVASLLNVTTKSLSLTTARDLVLVALSALHSTSVAHSEPFAHVVLSAVAQVPVNTGRDGGDDRAALVHEVLAVVPDIMRSWRPLLALANANAARTNGPVPGVVDAIAAAFVAQLLEDSARMSAVRARMRREDTAGSDTNDANDDDDAVPVALDLPAVSACALGAPRFHTVAKRATGLTEAVADALFPVDTDAHAGATPKRLEYLRAKAHDEYQRRMAALAHEYERVHNVDRQFDVHAASVRGAASLVSPADIAAQLASAPADEVVHPLPEPVVSCPIEELDDLLRYLKTPPSAPSPSAAKVTDTTSTSAAEMAFPRGTLMDGGRRLDLCKQVVGPRGIGPLLDALVDDRNGSTKGISTLMIGNNITGSAGAQRVAVAMADARSSITNWYCGGNHWDSDDVALLARALTVSGGDGSSKPAERIRMLWLKRNPVLEDGAKHLAAMLRINTTLEVLDVLNTGIQDTGAIALAQAVLANPTGSGLKHIYLDTNNLTPRAMAAWADVLAADNCSLESLSVSCNRLGDAGAEELARGLTKNTSLVRLVAASNGIGAVGARALARAAARHPTLAVLNLGYYRGTLIMGGISNVLGDAGALAVAEELVAADPSIHGLALRVLNLGNNGIGPVGIRALADAVRCASTSFTSSVPYPYGIVELQNVRSQHGQQAPEASVVRAIDDACSANTRAWARSVHIAIEGPRAMLDDDEALARGRRLAYELVAPAHVQDILSVYRTK